MDTVPSEGWGRRLIEVKVKGGGGVYTRGSFNN